jgi:hypothetical protein
MRCPSMRLHSRYSIAFRAALALSLAILAGRDARAAEGGFRPPFGLSWNMRGIDLEMALVGANGEIVTRKKQPSEGETWFVEGLPQLALQRAKFHLRKDRLAGIELEYGKEDWTAANYDGFMKSVRQRLEEKYAQGVQIARKQESDRGVLQTLVGYRWNVNGGSIELVYFAAQNPTNLFRTISLHYAADPPAEPAEPAPVP